MFSWEHSRALTKRTSEHKWKCKAIIFIFQSLFTLFLFHFAHSTFDNRIITASESENHLLRDPWRFSIHFKRLLGAFVQMCQHFIPIKARRNSLNINLRLWSKDYSKLNRSGHYKCKEYQEKVTQNQDKTFQFYKAWSAKNVYFSSINVIFFFLSFVSLQWDSKDCSSALEKSL